MADIFRSPTGAEVYCHECRSAWPRIEHGLTCPHCGSEFTEIVEFENDPREATFEEPQFASWTADIPGLHDHTSDASGSSEVTLNGNATSPGMPEGQFTHRSGRLGPIQFTSVTYHSGTPQGGGTQRTTRTRQTGMPRSETPQDDHAMNPVFQNFQELLRNIMGGRPADSPSDTPQPGQAQQPGGGGLPPGFPFGPPGGDGFPPLMGAHITYTSPGPLFPRDPNNPQPQAQPVEDLPGMLRVLVDDLNAGGMQPGLNPGEHPSPVAPLLNFFASFLGGAGTGANGDVVYSQEALDRVITQLMEQHAGSNAPGPASEAAIASLPRKKIDVSMLDDKGKAECTICMDEVSIGDEVMSLPCSHWFHEPCGTAWLKEHDTCPICRKGIMPQDDANATGGGGGMGSTSASRAPGEAPRNPEPWMRRPSAPRHVNSTVVGSGTFGAGVGDHRPTIGPRSRSAILPSNYPTQHPNNGIPTNENPTNNSNLINSRLFPSNVRGPSLPFYQSRFTTTSTAPTPANGQPQPRTGWTHSMPPGGFVPGQAPGQRNDGSGSNVVGAGSVNSNSSSSGITERIREWWDSVGGNNSGNNNGGDGNGSGNAGGGHAGGGHAAGSGGGGGGGTNR